MVCPNLQVTVRKDSMGILNMVCSSENFGIILDTLRLYSLVIIYIINITKVRIEHLLCSKTISKDNILKLNLLVMSGVKLIQIVNKIMTTQVLILLVLKQASRLRKLFLCELNTSY